MMRAGTFTCRASALRLDGGMLLNGATEPAVANAQDSPCVAETNSLTPTTGSSLLGSNSLLTPVSNLLNSLLGGGTTGTGGLGGIIGGLTGGTTGTGGILGGTLSVGLLTATTTNNTTPGSQPAAGDSASAASSVASLTLGAITTGVLQSSATVTCTGTGTLTPTFTSSSSVANVNIPGVAQTNTSSPFMQDITLLGQTLTVFLNRTITTPTSLTRRALEIDLNGSPLLVAGESQVDFTGNPCATA